MYISSKYFSSTVTASEIHAFNERYAGVNWDRAKDIMHRGLPISKNAILIAEKVQKHLSIDLFPCIHVVGRKGAMSSGAASFQMFDGVPDNRLVSYLFTHPAREYLLKRSLLDAYLERFGETWITIKDPITT